MASLTGMHHWPATPTRLDPAAPHSVGHRDRMAGHATAGPAQPHTQRPAGRITRDGRAGQRWATHSRSVVVAAGEMQVATATAGGPHARTN